MTASSVPEPPNAQSATFINPETAHDPVHETKYQTRGRGRARARLGARSSGSARGREPSASVNKKREPARCCPVSQVIPSARARRFRYVSPCSRLAFKIWRFFRPSRAPPRRFVRDRRLRSAHSRVRGSPPSTSLPRSAQSRRLNFGRLPLLRRSAATYLFSLEASAPRRR